MGSRRDTGGPLAPTFAMPRPSTRRFLCALLAPALLAGLAACQGGRGSLPGHAEAPARDGGYEVTIRRSAHGIPHIEAGDWGSLGYGYGYAVAQDNICRLADFYLTVNGERSRYHGPDATFPFPANLFEFRNADSDFFFKLIHASGQIDELRAAPPPRGPSARMQALLRGHIAGYNRFLRETGVDNISDPACRGAAWVQPISETDVYRLAHTLGIFAGWAPSAGGIGSAAPLLDLPPGASPFADFVAGLGQPEAAAQVRAALQPAMASNALGIGSEASSNGRGLLLGNPHQGWIDAALFYQVHLRIPGRFEVNGTSFLGLPFVVIGSTPTMAWSHTTSAAFRFVPVQLTLAGPYTYLVDGQPQAMQAWPLQIAALQPDGSVGTLERTLYSTRYGPMVTNIAGLDAFAWTPTLGFSIMDANAGHMRYLEHFLEIGQVGSVRALKDLLADLQGIPWANTVAADAQGEALYADLTVIANIDDAFALSCSTPLGAAAFAAVGLPVLDGSRSACQPPDAPDARQPGTMGPAQLPWQIRRDYLLNSNDSYWLSNPAEPLTGFPRVLGEEGTERRLRTRLGLTMIADRLAGRDDRPGQQFDHELLMDWMFDARQYLAELWLDDLLTLCSSLPVALGSNGPVDVSAACPVLAGWSRTDEIEARGALLFRRIATRLLGQTLPSGTTTQTRLPLTSGFLFPFDPADPVGTPRGLNIAQPQVQQALADAVAELQALGIPLDAPLGEHQYVERAGERIPLHGGLDRHGLFSILNIDWDPEAGAYANPHHGNTYTQVVSFDGAACPRLSTITTYGQSQDPTSPWHSDQTRMYRDKQWVEVPFCPEDVRAAARSVTTLRE